MRSNFFEEITFGVIWSRKFTTWVHLFPGLKWANFVAEVVHVIGLYCGKIEVHFVNKYALFELTCATWCFICWQSDQ